MVVATAAVGVRGGERIGRSLMPMLIVRSSACADTTDRDWWRMTQPWWWAPARPGDPLLQVITAGAIGEAPLPDDPPPASPGAQWAPGALAGVLGHHAAASSGPDDATEQVLAVLDRHRQHRVDRAALERMYQLLATGGVDIGQRTARMVLAHARAGNDPAREAELILAVRDLAGWLIDTGVDRGPVSTGICLAGVLPDCAGRQDQIVTLGLHATFAGDAVTAIARLGDSGTEALFTLARQHTGWGRIHAVEALVRRPRPDIRRWLLTEGFRNDVTWGYLALLVARSCGLAVLLAQTRDRRLDRFGGAADDLAVLDGARDLLSTMLDPYGPSGNISDYPDAGAATAIWLELTELRADGGPGIVDLAFVVELTGALADDDLLHDENGFGAAQRESIGAACRRLLADPRSTTVVTDSLAAGHRWEMGQTARVAAALGIDPFPSVLARLGQDPDDTTMWFTATQAVGPHAAELLGAARDLLPGDGVATDTRACIGPAPGPHMGVTFVLQQVVGRHPGVGWEWLAGLLRSPLPGIRGQALAALQAWPPAQRPADAMAVLRTARAREDDPKLRERFDAALG